MRGDRVCVCGGTGVLSPGLLPSTQRGSCSPSAWAPAPPAATRPVPRPRRRHSPLDDAPVQAAAARRGGRHRLGHGSGRLQPGSERAGGTGPLGPVYFRAGARARESRGEPCRSQGGGCWAHALHLEVRVRAAHPRIKGLRSILLPRPYQLWTNGPSQETRKKNGGTCFQPGRALCLIIN